MNQIIRKINNLEQISGKVAFKEGNISLADKSLNLVLLTDFNVSDQVNKEIQELIAKEIPQSFKAVNLAFEKIVAEEQFVYSYIHKYLEQSHKGIVEFLSFEKTAFSKENYNIKIDLAVSTTVYEFFCKADICHELEEYLNQLFVDDFSVYAISIEGVEPSEEEVYKPTDADLYRKEMRTYKVDEVARLFNNDPETTCVYIADTANFIGSVYVAGVINRIEERQTKNGKPFYLIEINDRTGNLTGMVFPTKTNLPKVQKLKPSSEIIAFGEFQKHGEYINFTFKHINLCVFPKNFVPQDRYHRECPKEYTLVFPKPIEIEKQDNFLEVKTVPECFIGRTFVVFDLETTGTDYDDRITEIGAVKLVDGVPTEYFSTLVYPEKHIPQEVVNITGITDEMVKNAPKFSQVCGDFYKFCQGATLVAHNIEFDSRFIKKLGEEIDYYFDNPLMDTLSLARENIFGVPNYKLNTLCDRFGIVFRHHRAYSDALATAELFVEIIRIRKSLPF